VLEESRAPEYIAQNPMKYVDRPKGS